MFYLPGLPPPGGLRSLSRNRLRDLLTGLSAEVEVTSTEYVPAGEWAGFHSDRPGLTDWEWLPKSFQESESGLVLVSGPELRLAISPPFPMQPPGTTSPGADFARLREDLAKRRTVAVVLLRLGAYAVGVIDDGELVASKTGTRYVHGRHRAGGQSQRRFERNREQWIRALFDRVCRVAQDRFKPYEGRIDHLALGGDRHVLARFMKACEALHALEDRLLRRTTPVERPGLGALRQACDSIWESRVVTAPGAG